PPPGPAAPRPPPLLQPRPPPGPPPRRPRRFPPRRRPPRSKQHRRQRNPWGLVSPPRIFFAPRSVRVAGRRRPGAVLPDPLVPVPHPVRRHPERAGVGRKGP